MCGCCKHAAACASFLNRCRCRPSSAPAKGSTFSATRRPRDSCSASYTTPHTAPTHLAHDPEVPQTGQQPPVQADGDHLPQPPAVAAQQLLAGRAVALLGATERFLGVGFGGRHGDFLYHLPAERRQKVTARRPVFRVFRF